MRELSDDKELGFPRIPYMKKGGTILPSLSDPNIRDISLILGSIALILGSIVLILGSLTLILGVVLRKNFRFFEVLIS